MDFYRTLFEILKILQYEENAGESTQNLLDRVIRFTDAQRGFIVVLEDGSFQEKYQVRFDKSGLSAQKRKFSRSLVREAIRSREILLSADLSDDPRFVDTKSVAALGKASILVAPLGFKDDICAVIYLERSGSDDPFTAEALAFVREFVDAAGIAFYRALQLENLSRFKQIHERDLMAKYNFEGIVTHHPKMLRLLETVGQMAQSDAPALIRGETGTGKELIAKALFLNGPRRHRPFVTLHCGALPESLFESELFGHVRGSFTSAIRDRLGRIAQAHGGTLFIDEVAEIPIASQAKLLRFFQFGEFQRIGSDRVDHVDVRIIAATHRDLEQMVAEGSFRQDLYYRLNVLELEIPPLRDRPSDVPLIIDFYLKKFWAKKGRTPRLSPEAQSALESYPFPGNVRELTHVLERASVLAREPYINLELLPRPIRDHYRENRSIPEEELFQFSTYSNDELKTARKKVTQQAVEELERAYLAGLLKQYGDKVSEAAKNAGMHRTYLYRLVAKYRGS